MKYKVGDKVRVRRDLEIGQYGVQDSVKKMVEFKGKTVTITDIARKSYKIKEDCEKWWWTDEMFESREYSYEDLCNSPIGTKITFESGKVLIRRYEDDDKAEKSLNCWRDEEYCLRNNYDLRNMKDNWSDHALGTIIKVEEPRGFETVYEKQPEILDEVEKEYLKKVIKPFKSQIEYVKKSSFAGIGIQNIGIAFKDGNYMSFPGFARDTMYRGMKKNTDYTLKELGL